MFIKFCCKAIITWRFIICFRIYRFYETSKDVSASQRLNCSLDICFWLGTLLRNSVAAAVEVCLVQSFSLIFFADLIMSLSLLEGFDLLSSVYYSNVVWFWIFWTLDTIIGEHQSEAIKNKIILHSFYFFDIIDMSNKLEKIFL